MSTKKTAIPPMFGRAAIEDPKAVTLDRLEQAQSKMQDGVSAAMKYWENSMAFGQGHIKALMQSSQIMATGLQELSKHIVATNRETIEESVAFTKSLMGAKSPQDAAHLQAGFVKASLAKGAAQNRELGQATVELAKQAVRPINEQMAATGKTFQKK